MLGECWEEEDMGVWRSGKVGIEQTRREKRKRKRKRKRKVTQCNIIYIVLCFVESGRIVGSDLYPVGAPPVGMKRIVDSRGNACLLASSWGYANGFFFELAMLKHPVLIDQIITRARLRTPSPPPTARNRRQDLDTHREHQAKLSHAKRGAQQSVLTGSWGSCGRACMHTAPPPPKVWTLVRSSHLPDQPVDLVPESR